MLSQDSVDHERRMADTGRQSEGRSAAQYGMLFALVGLSLGVEGVSVSVGVRAQSRRRFMRPLEGRAVTQVSD